MFIAAGVKLKSEPIYGRQKVLRSSGAGAYSVR